MDVEDLRVRAKEHTGICCGACGRPRAYELVDDNEASHVDKPVVLTRKLSYHKDDRAMRPM